MPTLAIWQPLTLVTCAAHGLLESHSVGFDVKFAVNTEVLCMWGTVHGRCYAQSRLKPIHSGIITACMVVSGVIHKSCMTLPPKGQPRAHTVIQPRYAMQHFFQQWMVKSLQAQAQWANSQAGGKKT